MRTAGITATLVALLGLAACGNGGIDFGDNPGPDVRKQVGPLTVPPPGVLSGKAR